MAFFAFDIKSGSTMGTPTKINNSLAFEKRLRMGSPQAHNRQRRFLNLQSPSPDTSPGSSLFYSPQPSTPTKLPETPSSTSSSTDSSPRFDVGTNPCLPFVKSPSKSELYCDRYIPSRSGNQWFNDLDKPQVRPGFIVVFIEHRPGY